MTYAINRAGLRPDWTHRQIVAFENRLVLNGWQAVGRDAESTIYEQPVTARRCIVTRFDRERACKPMLTITSKED
jgi:hypothetical protein